jgi:hypothetical protein
MRRHHLFAARALVALGAILGFFVQPHVPQAVSPLTQPLPSSDGAPTMLAESASTTPAPPPAPTALHAECAEFVKAAAAAGWRTRLRELERIAWRESRCQHKITNKNRNGTTDWGPMQINDVNLSHLRDLGIVSSPRELFEPHTASLAAMALYKRDGSFCSWRAPHYC